MNTIFDVGAHKGEDTEFYLAKGFKVVAIEANPVLAANLRQKFESAIASGQLTVVEAAIAEEEGKISFFVNELSVWGTIRDSWAARNQQMGKASEQITVNAVRFSKILEQYGVPYYLKIDIEGADMLCVRALRDAAQRPRFLSIESNKTSWKELMEEFSTLQSTGYNRFKVVNQAKISKQKEPDSTIEGRFSNHRFVEGSSGLFGQDLPGRWLSRRQALAQYALIFLQYKLFGDNSIGQRLTSWMPAVVRQRLVADWYDTHATCE